MNYLLPVLFFRSSTGSTIWPLMLSRGHSTGQKNWAICHESQFLYFVVYLLHINLVRSFTRLCRLSILSSGILRSRHIVPGNAQIAHVAQHIQLAAI